MINLDWIYETSMFEWIPWENDADWHQFSTYIMYGNRLLAKVYQLTNDDVDWSIIYINKNWNFKKYVVYWYYNTSAMYWFILWVMYNGERESNQSRNVSNLPNEV